MSQSGALSDGRLVHFPLAGNKGLQGTTIYQALVRQQGFTGSYSAVRRFLQALQLSEPRVSAVLDFAPGDTCPASTILPGRIASPVLLPQAGCCLTYSATPLGATGADYGEENQHGDAQGAGAGNSHPVPASKPRRQGANFG
jgi:hypothetical protein